ncbi:hypothetical protein IGB42_03780 [Andreprevotia sp. IGB-42]|nr:hypothetical protein IGB42_03780 [Andreprevotia sp. IGB-42]
MLARIRTAVTLAGRPADAVQLLAVSKTFPAADIAELYAHGQRDFGENYVQELAGKAEMLANLPELRWHFIGPLQSNKTRIVAETASWVHAIDRLKIAERLSSQRPEHLPPLQVCLQVNVSGETSKSGVTPEGLGELAQAVAALPRLKLRGLMCIPEATNDQTWLSEQFRQLRQLQQALNTQGLQLDTLSMGMSGDLESAITEGATLVRIGTALFGTRTISNQAQGTT